MKQLIDLLDDIAQNIEFNLCIVECDEDSFRAKADEYFNQFKTIYSRIERHRYSMVSKYIGSKLPDAVDGICAGLRCIIECAELNEYHQDGKESENYICYVKLCKLYDHILLESERYASAKKMELVAEDHSNQMEKVKKLINDANDAVSAASDKAEKLSEHLISILGIFAGIIVTFSFATNVAGNAIADLARTDVVYLTFAICVLGLVFLNVVALLMSFIANLSGHKFSRTFPWGIYIPSMVLMIALSIFLYLKFS